MPDIQWALHGREFANCNCSYGCPCQFNALPTYGNCRAVVGIQIDRGFHGAPVPTPKGGEVYAYAERMLALTAELVSRLEHERHQPDLPGDVEPRPERGFRWSMIAGSSGRFSALSHIS